MSSNYQLINMNGEECYTVDCFLFALKASFCRAGRLPPMCHCSSLTSLCSACASCLHNLYFTASYISLSEWLRRWILLSWGGFLCLAWCVFLLRLGQTWGLLPGLDVPFGLSSVEKSQSAAGTCQLLWICLGAVCNGANCGSCWQTPLNLLAAVVSLHLTAVRTDCRRVTGRNCCLA